jgi:ATP-dependent protease Clp ATPase subunit
LTGRKGDKTCSELLRSHIFRNGHHNILVLDEADKLCAPKFSGGKNVSQSIQSEGLTILKGAFVEVKISSVIHSIDTSKISFILCGAFSSKAHDVAGKSAGSRISFGAAPKATQPYVRPLEEQDLIDFGIMPELLGHIQRLVHLEPMTDEEYSQMLDTIKFLQELWHYPDEPGEAPKKYEMNVLMLLANAIEALSRLNAQYQMKDIQQP